MLPAVLTLWGGDKWWHFADDIFKYVLLKDFFNVLIQILLKLVPRGSIDNKPVLVQTMAWRWAGDKPLSETVISQVADVYIRVTLSWWAKRFAVHLLLTWLTVIPAWINDYIYREVEDEITSAFPNFYRADMKIWEWMSNFIPHLTRHVVTYPCWMLGFKSN